jgi:integrase
MAMTRYKPEDRKYRGIYFFPSVDGKTKTWYYTITHGGKKSWVKVGLDVDGYSPTMALNLRAEAVRAKKRNEYAPGIDKSITLDEGFEIYWTMCKAKQQKSTGPRLSIYNKYLKPAFGHMRMDKITPMMIEKQKGIWLNDKEMTPAYVMKILHLLKTIYNQCYRIDEYNGPKPMEKVDPISAHNKRLRFLEREDLNLLLDTLERKDTELYRQACLAGLAGLRPKEILSLAGVQINLQQLTITITEVKHRTNKAKTRVVSIEHPRLRRVIQQLVAEKSFLGPHEPFFATYRHRAFDKIVKDLGWNKGLEKGDRVNRVTMYTLRHTYAYLLALGGAHVKEIQEMMGHDSLQSTEVYLKASKRSVKSANEKFIALWPEEELRPKLRTVK